MPLSTIVPDQDLDPESTIDLDIFVSRSILSDFYIERKYSESYYSDPVFWDGRILIRLSLGGRIRVESTRIRNPEFER